MDASLKDYIRCLLGHKALNGCQMSCCDDYGESVRDLYEFYVNRMNRWIHNGIDIPNNTR